MTELCRTKGRETKRAVRMNVPRKKGETRRKSEKMWTERIREEEEEIEMTKRKQSRKKERRQTEQKRKEERNT